jgi:predicted RNA-binding protein (virulence factor B family)
MNSWVTWVIQTATMLMIGALGYYMKREQSATDTKIEKCNERIDKLEDKMENLPFVYTTREDFIRATTAIEHKLDKILDRLPPPTNP